MSNLSEQFDPFHDYEGIRFEHLGEGWSDPVPRDRRMARAEGYGRNRPIEMSLSKGALSIPGLKVPVEGRRWNHPTLPATVYNFDLKSERGAESWEQQVPVMQVMLRRERPTTGIMSSHDDLDGLSDEDDDALPEGHDDRVDGNRANVVSKGFWQPLAEGNTRFTEKRWREAPRSAYPHLLQGGMTGVQYTRSGRLDPEVGQVPRDGARWKIDTEAFPHTGQDYPSMVDAIINQHRFFLQELQNYRDELYRSGEFPSEFYRQGPD